MTETEHIKLLADIHEIRVLLTEHLKEASGARREQRAMRESLFGNGGEGVVERLRGLERWAKIMGKIIWVILVGSLGALGNFVLNLIQRLHDGQFFDP